MKKKKNKKKKKTLSQEEKNNIDWINKWGKGGGYAQKKKTNKVPDYVPQEEKTPINLPDTYHDMVNVIGPIVGIIAFIFLAVSIFNKEDPVGKAKGYLDDRSDKKEMCAERAEDASNSYAAKKIYKACMSR